MTAPQTDPKPVPRVIAWEITRACRLACRHCRAVAQPNPDPEQLNTEEGMELIRQIAAFSRPLLILTGGDPLLRSDIYDLARYATDQGLPVVVSPSGTEVTPPVVARLQEAGVRGVSISIDGPSPELHDDFRGVPGAFQRAAESLGYLRDAGMPFQINTTVSDVNSGCLREMWQFVVEQKAMAWDVFLLVPTGRATTDMEISPREYEKVLHFLYETREVSPVPIKVTCAPHYTRIRTQRNRAKGGGSPFQAAPDVPLSLSAVPSPRAGGHSGGPPHPGNGGGHPGGSTGRPSHEGARGCMAGNGFCFISNTGDVCGCGYLPLVVGNVREQPFREIYQEAPLFVTLRNPDLLQGKCGVCDFRYSCGGCRARALAEHGDVLAEEPFCSYRPSTRSAGAGATKG